MTIDDVEAITALEARYFRTMDTKRWSDRGESFTVARHDDTAMEADARGDDSRWRIAELRPTRLRVVNRL
ncbi:MAG: hypothetical protein OEW42_15905 [Acidimicrobiia bacterium]|nr:hypothetical protein [Acidimicrobiia bacterium]MDH5238441.1 hypothetical protein [Acidimicrobiia bacterium]